MASQNLRLIDWPVAEQARIGNTIHPKKFEDQIVVSRLLTALVEGGDIEALSLEFTVSSSVGRQALRDALSTALQALDKSDTLPLRVRLPIEVLPPA